MNHLFNALGRRIKNTYCYIFSQVNLSFRNFLFVLFKAHISSIKWGKTITSKLGLFAGTTIGLLVASFLYTSHAQKFIISFAESNSLFIAIGSIIGTMFALVLSLSIIPIQKATEIFSPSITSHYKNDRVTLLIFILLTFFCVASFILTIDNLLNVKREKLLPLGFFFIACSLDLLRWHHRHVSNLLIPNFAISRLSNMSVKYINQIYRQISRSGRLRHTLLPEAQKQAQDRESIEAILYNANPQHVSILLIWIDEISEITTKAISRSETNSACSGIRALVLVAQSYLATRKDNLVQIPRPEVSFFVSDYDVNSLLIPIYEHLQDVNQRAVTLQNESICIFISRAFGDLASYIMMLKSNVFPPDSAPLTYTLIYYQKECCKLAQRNNMLNVPLKTSLSLLQIGANAPNNININDVFSPIIDAWFEFTQEYYISGNKLLANKILSDIMSLMHHLLEQKHFQYIHILSKVLNKLEGALGSALMNEQIFGQEFFSESFIPYDGTKPTSFVHLVQRAATQIEKKADAKRVNPYRDFIEINTSLYRHFRKLAEQIDFSGSRILWDITQTIKGISREYLKLISQPITDNTRHLNDLAKNVPWYLSFFWVTFSKTKKFNFQRAKEACDVIAWVALAFYNSGYKNVSENCVSDILSIIKDYSKPNNCASLNDIADLYMFLWKIRILAKLKDDKDFFNSIDLHFENKIQTLNNEQWIELHNIMELEITELEERINQDEPHYPSMFQDDTDSLLKILIK